MAANKYKILRPTTTDKEINLTLNVDFDFSGRDEAISTYETEIIKEIIGEADDFEVDRFAHDFYADETKTLIKYDFYFFAGNSFTDTTPSTEWVNSYTGNTFTAEEIYYYSNNFTKSFFKLDFYDTTDEKTQKNYITIILPVQQGKPEVIDAVFSTAFSTVTVRKPSFSLDYVGDKEGFFIYWLKKRDFLNVDTFYMTAKFFDAKIGAFVRMMNTPQSNLSGNKYNFDTSSYFYYKVQLDYDKRTYQVFDINNTRVGLETNSIKWYEYLNP